MSNVKIHNFSSNLSTTYPRFGDKLIITSGKHVNTHITRCAPGTDRRNTINCVRRRKTLKSEGKERTILEEWTLEREYEGKMKNRKKNYGKF